MKVTANHPCAIMSLLPHLEEDYGIDSSRLLVCAEHTGQYTFPLACVCNPFFLFLGQFTAL